MMELKPCRCGKNKVNIIYENVGNCFWVCLVGCMSIVCDEVVVRFGLTKKQARRRAIKAWNRRAT